MPMGGDQAGYGPCGKPRGRLPRRALFSLLAAGAPFALLRAPLGREGASHAVRMTSHGASGHFVFEPALLVVEPGDRVRFVALDSDHNSQTITGMTPPGGSRWRSGIGREIEIDFEVEGVYGYMCRAHYVMGMVGLIVLGNPHANLAQALQVRHPQRTHRVFEALFAEVARRFPDRRAPP